MEDEGVKSSLDPVVSESLISGFPFVLYHLFTGLTCRPPEDSERASYDTDGDRFPL